MSYICPLCKQNLTLLPEKRSYVCENKHCYDKAKEGYVNLLPVQNKKSRNPGDSLEMIQARRAFLEQGFYEPLATKMSEMISPHAEAKKALKLLDLGCGEGYYLNQIRQQQAQENKLCLHGIDISKSAVRLASKKYNNSQFAVASSADIPYPNNYFDVLLCIFAPITEQEAMRILKPDGILIMVNPGAQHLWQIREFVYKEVRPHDEQASLNFFREVAKDKITYKIQLDRSQRSSLLDMTPLSWSITQENRTLLFNMGNQEVEVDFSISVFQK